MCDSVLAQVAALPEKSTAELKQLWRELYDREPPPYNRPFLVKRLAYRVQEVAFGGLSARAEAKLKALVEEEDRRLKRGGAEHRGDAVGASQSGWASGRACQAAISSSTASVKTLMSHRLGRHDFRP